MAVSCGAERFKLSLPAQRSELTRILRLVEKSLIAGQNRTSPKARQDPGPALVTTNALLQQIFFSGLRDRVSPSIVRNHRPAGTIWVRSVYSGVERATCSLGTRLRNSALRQRYHIGPTFLAEQNTHYTIYASRDPLDHHPTVSEKASDSGSQLSHPAVYVHLRSVGLGCRPSSRLYVLNVTPTKNETEVLMASSVGCDRWQGTSPGPLGQHRSQAAAQWPKDRGGAVRGSEYIWAVLSCQTYVNLRVGCPGRYATQSHLHIFCRQ